MGSGLFRGNKPLFPCIVQYEVVTLRFTAWGELRLAFQLSTSRLVNRNVLPIYIVDNAKKVYEFLPVRIQTRHQSQVELALIPPIYCAQVPQLQCVVRVP